MAIFTVSELSCLGDLYMLFVWVYMKALRFLLQRLFFSTEDFYHFCTYFPFLFKVIDQIYCFSYSEWCKQNTGKPFGHLNKGTGDQNASLYLQKEFTCLPNKMPNLINLADALASPIKQRFVLNSFSLKAPETYCRNGWWSKQLWDAAAFLPLKLLLSWAPMSRIWSMQMGWAGDKPGNPPVWACSRQDHSHIYPLIKSPMACSGYTLL